MQRREVLKGMLLGGALAAVANTGRAVSRPSIDGASAQLAMLERRSGGRLGVAILDTGNGRGAGYRDRESFLLCSTFKALLAATVLARVDAGKEHLDRRVVFGKDVLLDWAPVTSMHVGAPGLTIAQLCEAAITQSDNTAANLLIASVGGPAAVTRYVRSLGDPVTRLDRTEPTLNRWDGDKDTTQPAWMLRDLKTLLLGTALSGASRRQFTDWLLHNQTGANTLRKGLPPDWRIGDKTGSGVTANNDVAIIWPPGRKPLLVAAYYDNPHADVAARQAVLAEVGRIVATQKT